MFVDEAQAFTKTDNEIVTQLKAAKALIADPKNWYVGEYSNSRYDIHSATAFCSLGALWKVMGTMSPGDAEGSEVGELLRVAAERQFGMHPARVNDLLGHAAALQMYDLAIAEAKKLDV